MLVSFTNQPVASVEADTVAIGLYDGERQPELSLLAAPPTEVSALLISGEARGEANALALAHAAGKRWLLVGLGRRDDLAPERMRVAAAVVRRRARELSTTALCWQAPVDERHSHAEPLLAAIVEGTILADYRFDRYKTAPGKVGQPLHLQRLIVAAPGELAQAVELAQVVEQAAVVAQAANEARDLQNRAANDLTPTALAEHARSLGEQIEHLEVEVEGRAGLLSRGMGAFAAVAQGSAQEPALITLRYDPSRLAVSEQGHDPPRLAMNEQAAANGTPVLGLVGKAVTFDSGGISIKPGAKMSEMKFDMSGGAAVAHAIAAIARLRLPIRVIGVIGATENLPSGSAVKPGDIVTAANGSTIEINNTDAEGRLVLADCLHHAISLGAQRIVDLATLTGAVLVALGSTYAGLVSNDDELAGRVEAAGERTGEIVWRLPMHEEYDELIKGAYADLDNAPEARKAGTIVGGMFLSHFAAEVPWAHLDIAGCAWDLGRAYAEKHAAGFGVRLLVALARSYCQV